MILQDESVKVRQPVSPRSFKLPGLRAKLQGYAEIDLQRNSVATLYREQQEYSPEDYYGLIDPESIDPSEYVDVYLADLAAEAQWDNE